MAALAKASAAGTPLLLLEEPFEVERGATEVMLEEVAKSKV